MQPDILGKATDTFVSSRKGTNHVASSAHQGGSSTLSTLSQQAEGWTCLLVRGTNQ